MATKGVTHYTKIEALCLADQMAYKCHPPPSPPAASHGAFFFLIYKSTLSDAKVGSVKHYYTGEIFLEAPIKNVLLLSTNIEMAFFFLNI